jgi:hypothetical protein
MTITTTTAIELSDDAREALAEAIRYEDDSVAEAFQAAMTVAAIEAAIQQAQAYLRLFVVATSGKLAAEDLPLAVSMVQRDRADHVDQLEYETRNRDRWRAGEEGYGYGKGEDTEAIYARQIEGRRAQIKRCEIFLVEVA